MDMPSAEHDRLPGAGRPGPARHGDPERRERPTAERRHDRRSTDADPDVLLDVPIVKVDEIDLEVDDLRARVSLEAAVLDLLSLNVGADVGTGAGGAVRDVGTGAGGAVRDVGTGAGEATKDVGSGAGEATKDVGSDIRSGELAGALAKKSAQAGRDAAHRVAHALRRITES